MKMYQIFVILVVLLSGCNTKLKEENAALRAQTDSLRAESKKMQSQNKQLFSTIDQYKKTLTEIDENLKSIDLNTSFVGGLQKEDLSEADKKESIMARIASIKELLDNSKLKILALDKSLKEMRKVYGEQSEEVLALNEQIKEQVTIIMQKEIEYLELRSSMAEDFEELKNEFDVQVALTERLAEILNRIYYYAGSAKELREMEITDTEGGFIGMGKVKVLNANSNEMLFTRLKKDETDMIEFESKSIKLITDHAEGSYAIESDKKKTKLTITDKEGFWKTTNYLVIQTQ